MIGEQFQSEDLIAGLVLNLKPAFDKVAIWLKDSTNEAEVAKVKDDIVKFLNDSSIELEYQVFKTVLEAPKTDKGNKKKFNKNKNMKKDETADTGFARSEKATVKEGEDKS